MALTKTVGSGIFQRVGVRCKPIDPISADLSLLSRSAEQRCPVGFSRMPALKDRAYDSLKVVATAAI